MKVVEPTTDLFGSERSEERYIALASLVRDLTSARDWAQLTAAVGRALGGCEPATVRLWAMTDGGLREAGQANGDELPEVGVHELRRALAATGPVDGPGGAVLVGIDADDVSFGVLEVHRPCDEEVVAAAAPLIACRLGALAGQGERFDVLPVGDEATDPSGVIAGFARQAKQLLEHDRLSVYLVDHDGRAFERFAVATSAIVPGEGVRIPFEDVGLRHVIVNNTPIVSSDLGADPRLIGAEDRVIARAGFRGLLSVPLRDNGRPFGVLNFVSRKAGFYRQEDLPVAQQIADQIAAFVENLRRQRRVQGLVRRQASDRERTRLIRDLYQAVAQAVPEISAAAREIESATEGEARGRAERIHEIAEQGLADMRRAIVDLDPPGLETVGLAEMVEQALQRFAAQTSCETDLRVEGDASTVPLTVASAAYRVLQEALMNVRLHADGGDVSVRLSVDRGLVLEVEDDGAGFDTREALRSDGLGLRHMRERTEALGAFLTIQSEPRNGTLIRFKVTDMRDSVERSPWEDVLDSDDAAPEAALRVLVAETNVLLRAGLSHLVESNDDMRVVGEASSREQLRSWVRQLHPDVAVLSTALGNGDLEALVSEITTSSPSTAVLAVSQGDVSRAAELIEWGITGVIQLPIDEEGLSQAIRAVSAGTHVLGQRSTSDKPGESLTARERSILALVAAGLTNAQIGNNLFLATKTVERQVATIVRKLNAANRAHASAIGVSRRIIELPDQAL